MNANSKGTKITIFICSTCWDKYEKAKREIKDSLEEYDCFEVDFFENSLPRSKPVEQDYLQRVRNSDLVVVLADNKDGVKKGTRDEIKIAKEENRPILYFFCDENSSKKTSIQKNLEKSLSNPTFITVKKFNDIPSKVVDAVWNESVSIYKEYSNGELIWKTESDKLKESISKEEHVSVIEKQKGSLTYTKEIPKELLRRFPYTNFVLQKELGISFGEITEHSEEDGVVSELMSSFIGLKQGKTIDFEKLKTNVKRHNSGNVQKIVLMRYDAIQKYFKDDLVGARRILKRCIKLCNDTKSIPKWLKNDIAMDLRNIQYKIDYKDSKMKANSMGQKILNEDENAFYYPTIDRIVSEFHIELVKEQTVNNKSGLVQIGNAQALAEKLVSAFVVSYVYGSLTQMLMFRSRLMNYIRAYFKDDFDHKLLLLATRIQILDNDTKLLENFIVDNNIGTDIIKSSDVERLVECNENQPLFYERQLGKMLIIKHFGYFCSDKVFKDLIKDIDNNIIESINNDEYIFIFIPNYLKMITAINERVLPNKVLEIVYLLFRKHFFNWYINMFRMLKTLNIEKLTKRQQQRYQSFLIRMCKKKDINNDNNFKEMLQSMRNKGIVDHEKLDSIINEKMPDYYNGDYLLNTTKYKKREAWRHIKGCIEEIQKQNKYIREKGSRIFASRNSIIIIGGIIAKYNITLTDKQINEVVETMEEVIFCPGQYINAKIDALEILCFIQSMFGVNDAIKSMIDEIEKSESNVLCEGENNFFLQGYTRKNILYHYELLKVITKKGDNAVFTKRIMELQNSDINENIVFLNDLEFILRNSPEKTIDSKNMDTIVQFLLYSSYNNNWRIRLHAVGCLVFLLNTKWRKDIFFRLSEVADKDVCEIKVAMISRMKYRKESNVMANSIYEKALKDSNYWVRKIVEDDK